MRVFEIMTIEVGSCRLDDNLSRAAAIMWEKDCGVVPVVDDEMRVIGVVTDRDIAIAAASQNRRPSEISARELLCRRLEFCQMEDSLADVLRLMSRARVRRLPVCGENGELLGMISIADMLRRGGKKISKRAVKTLLEISSGPKGDERKESKRSKRSEKSKDSGESAGSDEPGISDHSVDPGDPVDPVDPGDSRISVGSDDGEGSEFAGESEESGGKPA